MIDQATELRKLVLRAMRENALPIGPPPRLMVVTGSQEGGGVTSLAVNLSVALAIQGSRVVIVDADARHSEVAARCGLPHASRSADVLLAERDIHEVLQRGPAGIQVVPGLRAAQGLQATEELVFERLKRQLRTLGRHADIVVIDVGSEHSDLLGRFCAIADDVLLVTTPEDAPMMAAYARIKTTFVAVAASTLRLVVNRATDERRAMDVHQRINGSCQKFLGFPIRLAGVVPSDPAVNAATLASLPFVLGEPTSPAAIAVERLAASLADTSSLSRAA